jgi:hypothetical protein
MESNVVKPLPVTRPLAREYLLLLVALFLAGCTPAAGTPAAPVGATPTPPAPHLPVRFAEVEPLYTQMERETLERGKESSDLLVQGRLQELYDRFDAELQAQVPFAELERVVDDFTRRDAIGNVVATRFATIGSRAYAITVHAWHGRGLALYTTFHPDGTIADIVIAQLRLTPLDPSHYPAIPVTFRLPFEGLWYVAWGGMEELHNYHVTAQFQQFAYDFVIWKDGSTCRNDCADNEDYYAFGQPILAPASGTVVAAVGDRPDVMPGHVIEEIAPGNYVLIQVAEGAYLFVAHMQQGSVRVQVGDSVQVGEEIGRVGNSGRTSEPHIHIHLQDSPTFRLYGATGLPLYFTDYLADGEPAMLGMPAGSQFVARQEVVQ